MQLSDYIGREIILMIPTLETEGPSTIKLLAVEAGGIWIENAAFANLLFKTVEAEPTPTPPAFFVPYHAVQFGVVFPRKREQPELPSPEQPPGS